MPHRSKVKGNRVEREFVHTHLALGVPCKKVPLSGAAKHAGREYEDDLRVGDGAAAMHAEVKSRKSGEGFKTLERWLGTNELLFLRRNHAPPVVVMPWATYARLIVAYHATITDKPGPQEATPGDADAPAVPV